MASAKQQFKRFVPTTEYAGSGLQGYVNLSYKELRKIFGAPLHSDGYKVSTEWCIKDVVTGRTFSLYDYKETNLYDSDLPSVRKFRQLPSYDWHIGCNDLRASDAEALQAFLSERVGRQVTVRKGW